MKILVRCFFLSIFLFASIHTGFAGENPMWEGFAKTQKMRDADAAFITSALQVYNGDRQSATRDLVTKGFIALDKKDPETAIKRLNQAWLVDPVEPAIYWGYALALHMRGGKSEDIDRFFAIAEKSLPDDPRLMADHGRVLEEQGVYDKARSKFESALALAPGLEPAIIGMVRVSVFTGDKETEEKYRKILKQIRP